METQSGKTMVEMIAVICLIGVLTVMGSRLFAKATNTLRANYIMQEVFVRANELIENSIDSNRNSGKIVDISLRKKNSLSYGYSFEEHDTDKHNSKWTTGKCTSESGNIKVVIKGEFSQDLCNILKDKIFSQEYAGLKDIVLNDEKETKLATGNCPEGSFTVMKFVINPEFRKQSK